MRKVWFHAAMATLALAYAGHVWLQGAQPTAKAGEVELLACAPERLQTVTVRGKDKTVAVHFEDEGRGGWIEVKAPKRDAVAPPGGVTPTETRDFAASAQISRLVEALTPLKAQRALGVIEAAGLKELGLAWTAGPAAEANAGADPAKARDAGAQETVEIVCGERTLTLQLGAASYGGGGRYARNANGGEVVLLAEGWVGDARMADLRFLQRELHAFAVADIERMEVSNAAGSKTFLHRNRRGADAGVGADEWVAETEPGKRHEMAGNWVAAVLRLRVLESLGRSATPGNELQPAQTAAPIAKVAWAGDKQGTLELARAGDGETAVYYARTEATRGWVTVPRAAAERVCDDVPVLLGQASAPVQRKPVGEAAAQSAAAATLPGAATPTEGPAVVAPAGQGPDATPPTMNFGAAAPALSAAPGAPKGSGPQGAPAPAAAPVSPATQGAAVARPAPAAPAAPASTAPQGPGEPQHR